MHRHREDKNPTGQTFSQPATPARPSVSRSSSFRRNFSPTFPLSRQASLVGGPPSRPHSPSPLRPHTPTLHLSDTSTEDLGSSPLLSPRHLNVKANEFKPRPSPVPAAASLWSPFPASPLGTPKTQNPPQLTGGSTETGSFFPSTTAGSLGASPVSKTSIPRDPWSSASLPGISNSTSTSASSESSVDEPADPFSPFPDHASLPRSGSARDFLLADEWRSEGDKDPWNEVQQSDLPVEAQEEALYTDSDGAPGRTAPYSMTPLDLLCSVFATADISAADLEDALGRNGWDVDRAIEWIISNPPASVRAASARFRNGSDSPVPSHFDPDSLSTGLQAINLSGIPPRQPYSQLPLPGARPLMISRDSFDNRSPRSSAPPSPHWTPRPLTSTGYSNSAATNRVCRYYLQGSCLRSDCRYNHDISKVRLFYFAPGVWLILEFKQAVCRFWLRGHCLKGAERCDFMHM